MEQLDLEATQRLISDRHAATVRNAEIRRLQRERSAASAGSTQPTAAASPVRIGILTRLAGLLRPAHRPALS